MGVTRTRLGRWTALVALAAAVGALAPGPSASAGAAAPDVAVQVSASPASARVGQQLIYHVTVSNRGRAGATAVSVGASLSGPAKLVSTYLAGATCAGTTTVTCGPVSLAPGQIATLRIVVLPTQAADLVNDATVTAVADTNPTNDHASLTTPVLPTSAPSPGAPAGQPDLSVRLSSSATTAHLGEQLVYRATVTNHGRATGTGATATVALSGPVTLVSTYAIGSSGCSGTAPITCPLAPLASGQSASVRIVASSTQLGNVGVVASVSGGGDANTTDNQASVTTAVVAVPAVPPAPTGPPDLAVQLSATPASVHVGDQLVYHVSVGNRGRGSARGVSVSAALTGSATIVSSYAAGGSGCSGTATLVCTFDSIAPGRVVTVRIVAAPSQSGTLVLAASAATTGDSNATNNQASISTSVLAGAPNTGSGATGPDLAVQLDASSASVGVGDDLIYHVTVTNRAALAATGVVVTAALSRPAKLVSSYAPGSSGCAGTTTVTCTFQSLGAWSTASVRLVVRPTQPGELAATASVTAAADTNAANDHAVTTTIVAGHDAADGGDAPAAAAVSAGGPVRAARHRAMVVLSVPIAVHRPAVLTLSAIDPATGRSLVLLAGSSAGSGLLRARARSLTLSLGTPRDLLVHLRVARASLRAGRPYAVRIESVDADGTRVALSLPFRLSQRG